MAALLVIVTSLVADIRLSLAVSRNVYVPATENVAVALSDDVLLNVTVPGPLTLLQLFVKAPDGSPSSVEVPARIAADGNTTV